GTVRLYQTAAGGGGSYSASAAGGAGGASTSSLTFDDTINTTKASTVRGYSHAYGGARRGEPRGDQHGQWWGGRNGFGDAKPDRCWRGLCRCGAGDRRL